MPNSNFAFGLRPVRRAHGGVPNFAVRRYFIPAADTNAMFVGDPVVLAGSADPQTGAYPTVALATAGATNRITGVIVGFDPTESIQSVGYRLASTAAYALVIDDPGQLYEIQEDSVGGALAVTDIGLNADLVAGTGSAFTKLSGWQLDTSTKATGATLQVRIVGLVDRPDNEIGANAKVLVRLNLTTETGAAGSTGI